MANMPIYEEKDRMITFKRKNEQQSTSVVLDTSGIIDGRILEIARAGFVPQNVIVAQFVIAELQFLADHGDTHKRERARYGLDIVRELQDVRHVEVSIAREKFEDIKEVDDKLVALAKQYGAFLYTTDFNLNKVAQIEGIQVLNVNELAHALRPNLLPGERVTIKLTQVGQDKTQGVGYLNDGTMVVVEQAGRYIGQQVQAICTRILQTQAGKMMFATLASQPQTPTQPAPSAEPARQKPARQQSAPQPNQHSERRDNNNHKSNQPRPQEPNAKQSPRQRQQGSPPQQQRQNQPGTATNRPQPAQGHAKPQQNQNRGRKRRVSPEDSLLATLEEIQR